MTLDGRTGAAETTVEYLELRDATVTLPAAVYRPNVTGPSTSIVIAPGGLARGDLETSRWAGERLAAAGYLALVSSYRAASPYDDVRDLGLALDWLERDQSTRGSQFVALGHSRGGLATLGLAAADQRVRAVVLIAAPADMGVWVRAVDSFAPSARYASVQFMGGTPDEIPEQYERVRALSLAAHIQQPVLLIHGTADMRVPPQHSEWMTQALRASGNDRARLELVSGMGHFLELSTLGYQFDSVIALVTQWLKNGGGLNTMQSVAAGREA
jgi:dipeptidyl aminopeptidase/acylaminoacyl peptidase